MVVKRFQKKLTAAEEFSNVKKMLIMVNTPNTIKG